MKLVIGTANFGSNYGIANKYSTVTKKESFEILKLGFEMGIRTLDTSPAYSNAEDIIGEYHKLNEKFSIHTKISNLSQLSKDLVEISIKKSIKKINVNNLDVIYFHDAELLLSTPTHIVNGILDDLTEELQISKWGVSVYNEYQIREISLRFPRVTVFQVPENILDQRLKDSLVVQQLSAKGIEFFVRSIFLQGLLLLKPSEIPNAMSGVARYIVSLNLAAQEIGLSPLQISLSYLSGLTWATGFLVGVTSKVQLQEIQEEIQGLVPLDSLPIPLPELFIDPRNWPKF